MDNASKALIMAGAILLAVAIIGIGIYIFNYANGLIGSSVAGIDAMEASLSNQKFNIYMGKKIRGSQIKELLNEVIINNKGNSELIRVNVYDSILGANKTHQTSETQIKKIINAINDGSYYTISVTKGCKYYENGYRSDGTIGCMSIHVAK